MKSLLHTTRVGLLACTFGLLWYFGWSSAASLPANARQQSCTYTLEPISQSFDAQGGNGTLNVTTASNCTWTVSNPLNWVTLTSPTNRTGSGTVTFIVSANLALAPRRGELTVAGRVFTIEQVGIVTSSCETLPVRNGQPVKGTLTSGDCRATTQGSNGGFADKYEFTAQAGELIIITMNAASFAPHLYLFGSTGALLTESFTTVNGARLPSGSRFYPAPTTGTYTIVASTRTPNATGNYSLTLTSAPVDCDSYSIFPSIASFETQGGTGGFQVAVSNNCPWRAISHANWLTVTTPGAASGSLPVRYSVAANAETYRVGIISVGNQDFTVEQAGVGGQCGPRPLANGQTLNSTLSDADCRSRLRNTSVPSAWAAERFSFMARAGEQLVLNFTSGFTPYLYLLTSGNQMLAESAGPRPLESSTFTIPADGEYLLEVTTRSSFERGDYALALNLFAPGCGYGITPGNQVMEASGGNGTVTVTAGNDCPWTARANAAWLTVTSGNSGTGNGTVRFTAAPNVEAIYRSATLTIAGQTFTVEQPGAGSSCTPRPLSAGQRVNSTLNTADCRSRLRPTSSNPYFAERFSFAGVAGQQVRFTTTTNNSFFTPYLLLLSAAEQVLAEGARLLPTTSGYYTLPADGLYLLEVTVESASGGGAYTLLFETQPAGCSYLIAPSFLGVEANGGMHSFNLTAPPGCAWTATNNASWLTFTEGSSGSGSGALKLNVAANNTTVLRRATLLVAGRTLTVDQAGAGGTCTPQPLSAGQTVTGVLSNADCRSRLQLGSNNTAATVKQYSLNLQAGQQVFVSATAADFSPTLVLYNASGREVARGSSRLPNTGFFEAPTTGSYLLEVTTNFVTFDNKLFSLSYHVVAANCSYALSVATQSFDPEGGTGTFSVTAGAGCIWTANASATWITLTTGASGTGNGQVEYRVSANPSSAFRSGTINVAGRSFNIEQAGQGGTCLPVPLTFATPVNGRFNPAADCRASYRFNSATPANRYRVTLNAGSQIAFAVTNLMPTSLAPYLYLADANGVLVAESGITGGGAVGNARLPTSGFFSVPANGVYSLEIVSSVGQTGSYTIRLEQPSQCSVSFTPTSQRFETQGGAGSFNFLSGSMCNWTVAVRQAPWLTLTSNPNVTGSGTVNFTVAANTQGPARNAVIQIGGRDFIVEQAGNVGSCLAQPLTANQTLSGSLTVADCPALYSQVVNQTTWADRFTLTGKAGDQLALFTTVTGTPSFNLLTTLVDPRGIVLRQTNSNSPPPAGSNPFFSLPLDGIYQIEIALTPFGNTSPVNYQFGVLTLSDGCRYSLTPSEQSFLAAGGEGSITVTASSGCAWETIPSTSWIFLLPNSGAGIGNGTVRFVVAPNETQNNRTGTIQIADRVFQISQAGVGGSCSTTPLTPGQVAKGTLSNADCLLSALGNRWSGDRFSFTGQAGEQVVLQTLMATGLFLEVLSPDGVSVLRIDERTRVGLGILPVTGTYLIEVSGNPGEYQLLLTLAPGTCVYTLAPTGQTFDSAGGTGSVRVRASSVCAWSALATADWVTFAPVNGQGEGTINFTVAPNAGAALRTARLLIAGQEFVIEQAGAGGNCSPVPLMLGPQMPHQTVNGVLNEADCRRPNQPTFVDRYSFTASAGQQLLAIATGSANQFTAFELTLTDAQGNILRRERNTTSSQSVELRLPARSGFFTLPSAGTYLLEIVLITTGGGSSYTLNVMLAPGGCAFSATPPTFSFNASDPNGNQTGQASIRAGQGCNWMASTTASWLSLTNVSGTGDGTLIFAVAPNATPNPRTGRILLADQTITVEQAGLNGMCVPSPLTPGQAANGLLVTGDCTSLARRNASLRADRYTFNGTAGERVNILATGRAVTQTGAQQLTQFALALFDPAGALLALIEEPRLPRSGLLSLPVSGAYTIEISSFNTGAYTLRLETQTACSYTVGATVQAFEAQGGAGAVPVVTTSTCNWGTGSNVPWIMFDQAGATGSGNGAAGFIVAPNPDARPRTGVITVADTTITVTQQARVALVSAASFTANEAAPNSIVAAFGLELAASNAAATTMPLPTTLAGTTVQIRDNTGTTRLAALFAVTPGQVNFLLPAETAAGAATVLITNHRGVIASGNLLIAPVAPGLFAANANGRGVPAGVVLRVRAGVQSLEPLTRLDPATNRFVAIPIDLGPEDDEVYLVLFGTGLRNGQLVTAQLGGTTAPVTFAGAQGLAGLDQLNLAVPRVLAGRGDANLVVTVDGKAANALQVTIR